MPCETREVEEEGSGRDGEEKRGIKSLDGTNLLVSMTMTLIPAGERDGTNDGLDGSQRAPLCRTAPIMTNRATRDRV